MNRVSEEKINEIRNSADIVSIISNYVSLKSQGKNYFGICPFHDDHTPSMSVSPERQLYKCFVCNKGGNVFTFVKDYENISFIEAVKRVADSVGIPLEIGTYKKENEKLSVDYEIMDYTTKIFQNNLNSTKGEKAKEYLKERGITEEIIKDFKIGYSLSDNTYLYNVLIKKKYDLNKLDDLGLITKDGISGYDKFINRIMIPLTDLDGKVVGFTGRIFNGEASAKYINTKETKIYVKGKLIFNYHNAKNYIRDEKCAIIVEGNMDAIRMYSNGIKNVLAIMGTVVTKEQINILKKLRVPIILVLDNDEAGELATNTIGEELTSNNIDVKVVRLTDAKDPDEYIIKFGKDKFIDAIKNSVNYLDYKLWFLKKNKNLNNTEELISYVKNVMKMIDNKDNITKEITIRKLSDEYNIDYDLLKEEANIKEEVKEKKIIVPKKKSSRYEKCVHEVLYYMMSDQKYLKIFNSKLGFLKEKNERTLVSEIEYYIKKHKKINLADFISYAEENEHIKDLVNVICGNIDLVELDEKVFLDYIEVIKDILNKEERQKLIKELKMETDINKQLELSEKLKELVKGSVYNERD